MSRQLLSLDPAIVEQCNLASGIPSEVQSQLIQLSIDSLEGKEIGERLAGLAKSLGASNAKKFSALVAALSTLVWECAKATNNISNSTRDTSTLSAILAQLGMEDALIQTFCKEFSSARRRLNELKLHLQSTVQSYKDIAWRLDVELSKRSLLTVTDPVYQLRIDLSERDLSGSPATDSTKSCHLQCDYANMKNIQSELQKAIDAYHGVHSQRVMRYIA